MASSRLCPRSDTCVCWVWSFTRSSSASGAAARHVGSILSFTLFGVRRKAVNPLAAPLLGRWAASSSGLDVKPKTLKNPLAAPLLGRWAASSSGLDVKPKTLKNPTGCSAAAQVGSILNFSLMYLLAPTAGAAAGGGGLLQRIFSEQILAGWGAPGRGPALQGLVMGFDVLVAPAAGAAAGSGGLLQRFFSEYIESA